MSQFILRSLEEEAEKREPSANSALSYLGNIFSMIYFATPLIMIIRAYKIKLEKNDIPIMLIVLMILNCLLWLINAFASGDLGAWIPLLISNGSGILINVALMFLYLNLLLDKNWKHFLFYGIYTLDVIAQISYFMFRYIILADKDNKTDDQTQSEFHAIGFVATVINIFMYSSTFINIIKMMKTKKADKLLIFTLGMGLLCTIIFMVQGVVQYSYYDRDDEANQRMYAIETMVSNGISFLSLAIQGGIWLFYFLTGSKGLEIDETIENLNASGENNE